MTINDTEKAVLEILKFHLFNVPIDENETFFNNADWQQIFDEANSQAVLPLLVQGISDFGRFNIEHELFLKWKKTVFSQIMYNENSISMQNEAIKLFEESDISYAILKGTSVSSCYPKPELRVLGDIDILFKPDDCKKAVDILCNNSYTRRDLNLNVHEVVDYDNTRIEPHYMVAELPDNPAGKYLKSFLSDAVESAVTEKIDNYIFSVLSARHQAVALLLHMERHITHEGIGLRQICDWATFIHKRAYNEIWKNEIHCVLIKSGLLRFAEIITKTCVIYLGLPQEDCIWCENTDNKTCDIFISFVMKSGNMGRKQIGHNSVKGLSVEKDKKYKRDSLIKTILANTGYVAKRDFPICVKYPFVFPFIWMYVPIRYILKRLFNKNKKVSIMKTLSEAKKEKELYNRMELFQIR